MKEWETTDKGRYSGKHRWREKFALSDQNSWNSCDSSLNSQVQQLGWKTVWSTGLTETFFLILYIWPSLGKIKANQLSHSYPAPALLSDKTYSFFCKFNYQFFNLVYCQKKRKLPQPIWIRNKNMVTFLSANRQSELLNAMSWAGLIKAPRPNVIKS